MKSVTLKKTISRYRQFILYSIIGAGGALLDLMLFMFLYNVFKMNPLLATTISISAGITNNFILNTLFNFKKKEKLSHRFFSFYSIGILGLILSIYIIHVLHNIAGIDANIAKLLSIPFIVFMQYYLNARISFSNNPQFMSDFFGKISRALNKNKDVAVVGAFASLALLITAPYFKFVDEADNILGGKLILQGSMPYADFFSHHMPLPYFLSSFLLSFSTNLVVFRILFALLNIALLAITMRIIYRYVSRRGALLYGIFAPLILLSTWGNMLLAEVLVGHIVVILTLLLIIGRRKPTLKLSALISVSLAVMVLSGLSYVYLAGIFGAIYCWRLIRSSLPAKLIAKNILLLLSPYILFIVILLLSGALSEFIFQNYTFNTEYYSKFSAVGDSVVSVFINTPRDVLLSIYTALSADQHMLFKTNFVYLYAVFGACLYYGLFRKRLSTAVLLSLVGTYTLVRLRGFGDTLGVHYLLPWRMFGLLCFILGWQIFSLEVQRVRLIGSRLAANLAIVGMAAFILIGLGGLLRDSYYVFNTYRVRTPETAGVMIYDDNPTPYVNIINERMRYAPKDQQSVWMAPLQFHDLYNTNYAIASRYTFFLPWQGVCAKCTNEILSDLKSNRPAFIYWKESDFIILPSYVPREYGASINRFIHDNYVSYPGVKNLYVHKDATEVLPHKPVP